MEGKLSIWIKSGNFTHASDLYIQVLVDDNEVPFVKSNRIEMTF